MPKIVFCCTVPSTFNFSKKIFKEFETNGWEVIIISSNKDELELFASENNIRHEFFPFSRSISPLKDFKSIIRFRKLIKKINPDVIVGATPKASLITMIGAKLAGIRHRIYHIYGLPYETAGGIMRTILKAVERITASCATDIIPISPSVRTEYIRNGLCRAEKIADCKCLTVGGVDMMRFNPDILSEFRKNMRASLGIPDRAKVIGFVGRLTNDKGIEDIIYVWEHIDPTDDTFLVLVGDLDTRDAFSPEKFNEFTGKPNVIHVPFNAHVEQYFAIMDLFLFPSHREGFGNVSVEAQSMNIPVVAYDVTGSRDAVSDGMTGQLIEFRNKPLMSDTVKRLLSDSDELRKYSSCARQFVAENYSTEKVASNLFRTISTIYQ